VIAALKGKRTTQIPPGEVLGISGSDPGIALGGLVVIAGLVMAEGLGERLLDVFGFHEGTGGLNRVQGDRPGGGSPG
jgi:hypothetical protein